MNKCLYCDRELFGEYNVHYFDAENHVGRQGWICRDCLSEIRR